MIQNGFIFDANRCTGCNACQLACTLENELDFTVSWRKVFSFNPDHLPDQPVFHLSLACNHCVDPDCLRYCPTQAYQKDPETGLVLLNSEHCIGCRYCSWVCPYDAPVYDRQSGLMTKCTFCDHRQKEGREPACVVLCPTEALRSGRLDPYEMPPRSNGFPASKMGPAIRITPFRRGQQLPDEINMPFDSTMIEYYRRSIRTEKNKISLRNEWTLMVFSFISAILVGNVIAANHAPAILSPVQTVFLLVVCACVSLLHLGKKSRAYRAILNWRRSWLSREIIGFGLFSVLTVIQLYNSDHLTYIGFLTALTGMLMLYAMDRVYLALPGGYAQKWPSSSVLLTAMLFAALVTRTYTVFYLVLAVKMLLFFRSYLTRSGFTGKVIDLLPALRILIGFIVLPLSTLFALVPDSLQVLLLLGAELTDRILFYQNLEVITPDRQMTRDLQKALREGICA